MLRLVWALSLLLALLLGACKLDPPPGSADASNANPVKDDAFIWGTECGALVASGTGITSGQQSAVAAVRSTLNVRLVKLRLGDAGQPADGDFLSLTCPPNLGTCFDLDETVRLFRDNGWSMFPMISHLARSATGVSDAELARYVDFVGWFVDRYHQDADIHFVELINFPGQTFPGTNEQLVALSNEVHDRIHAEHPGIAVGTPGFEYWMDAPATERSISQIEYFLDPANGARFDFWAFHGYPTRTQTETQPPTKTAAENRYAGVPGILEVRRRLDGNGWQDREIIDAEHTGTTMPKATISPEEDRLEAAYMVQELVLKRSLRNGDAFALAGVLPLKMVPRGNGGEAAWGSLNPDGSTTLTVRAVGLLWSKLRGLSHSGHVNGRFDVESEPWVEKFEANGRELYVLFKPLAYHAGQNLSLDAQTLPYTVAAGTLPQGMALTELDGTSRELPLAESISVDVGNAPVFVEIRR